MFGSNVLEVAVCLIFVYLVLSTACSAINEWTAALLHTRANTLEQAIRKLLNAPSDGTYQIRAADLKDPADLAVRLKGRDPFAQALRARIAPADLQVLDGYTGGSPQPPVVDALVRALNAVIEGSCLYDARVLGEVNLPASVRQETERFARGGSPATRCARINRLLLQAAFPEQIAGLIDRFYAHPLIKALSDRGHHPPYIPSRTFALAVMDIAATAGVGPTTVDALRTGIANLPDSDVKVALLAVVRDAGTDLEKARDSIEQWFNDTMDRVSGWYKRRTHMVILALGLGITAATNADTIRITQTLWAQPAVRTSLEAAARQRAGQAKPAGLNEEELAKLQPLLGWPTDIARLEEALKAVTDPAAARWRLSGWILAKVAGLILTGLAISLGAPFWFDLLNKVANVRSVGRAPDEKPKST